jgi:hypothetical protein
MLLRKPPIWNVQPGLVARPWREHWRTAKAVFRFWEADGSSIYPAPRFTQWTQRWRRPQAHPVRPGDLLPGQLGQRGRDRR